MNIFGKHLYMITDIFCETKIYLNVFLNAFQAKYDNFFVLTKGIYFFVSLTRFFLKQQRPFVSHKYHSDCLIRLIPSIIF